MGQVAGKTFLITGGASGIGLNTARALRECNAQLVLWDVNEAALRVAGTELGAETAVVDITQAEQIEAALSPIDALHGVIHCAGIMRTGTIAKLPVVEQQQVLNVNLTGSLLLAHATIPHLRATGGSLVLLASVSAFYGPPEFGAYAASKAGVLNLAQTLRLELEREGIHVAAVCPFFVATPMVDGIRTKLFRRFGVSHQPEDVARAIVRGIEQRRFMIWPSWQPAFFHWLNHAIYPLRHALMRMWWR